MTSQAWLVLDRGCLAWWLDFMPQRWWWSFVTFGGGRIVTERSFQRPSLRAASGEVRSGQSTDCNLHVSSLLASRPGCSLLSNVNNVHMGGSIALLLPWLFPMIFCLKKLSPLNFRSSRIRQSCIQIQRNANSATGYRRCHAFNFSIIEYYHLFWSGLPCSNPVGNIPCFRLPALDIFQLDASSPLQGAVAGLPSDIECLVFCLEAIPGHSNNVKGIKFHITEDLNFNTQLVYSGLFWISSPYEVDDFNVDKERRVQNSEEIAAAAEMAIANLERLKV